VAAFNFTKKFIVAGKKFLDVGWFIATITIVVVASDALRLFFSGVFYLCSA